MNAPSRRTLANAIVAGILAGSLLLGASAQVSLPDTIVDVGALPQACPEVPSNGCFVNAIVVPATPYTNTQSTTGALVETGEPVTWPGCIINTGATVWYRWTPSTAGTATISTISSSTNYDTTLAVYTGNSVSALTPVAGACNDDVALPNVQSDFKFPCSPGTTYQIQVGGKAAAMGNVQITIRGCETRPPPNPPPPPPPPPPSCQAWNTVFFEDFTTDPNTNGQWDIYRRTPDPANEAYWDNTNTWMYLTKAVSGRASAMVATTPLPTTQAWKADFDFFIGNSQSQIPADGIEFLVYKDGSAYAVTPPDSGGTIGFTNGGPIQGYGIEMDTYYNAGWDSTAFTLAVVEDSHTNHVTPEVPNAVSRGAWWHQSVNYDPAAGTFGTLSASVTSSFGTNSVSYVLSAPPAFTDFGFSSATGNENDEHIIDGVTLQVCGSKPPPECSWNTFFWEDFTSDPNSNGNWNIHRLTPDPATEATWDNVNGWLYLTKAVSARASAIIGTSALPVGQPWKADFDYFIGNSNSQVPADGIEFLFYKDGSGYGAPDGGGALGFTSGGPIAGYGVELDTYYNSGWDASPPTLSVVQDTYSNHVTAQVPAPNIRGAWYHVNVDYDSATDTITATTTSGSGAHTVTYFLNGVYPALDFGFSSATGWQNDEHILDNVRLQTCQPGPPPPPPPCEAFIVSDTTGTTRWTWANPLDPGNPWPSPTAGLDGYRRVPVAVTAGPPGIPGATPIWKDNLASGSTARQVLPVMFEAQFSNCDDETRNARLTIRADNSYMVVFNDHFIGNCDSNYFQSEWPAAPTSTSVADHSDCYSAAAGAPHTYILPNLRPAAFDNDLVMYVWNQGSDAFLEYRVDW